MLSDHSTLSPLPASHGSPNVNVLGRRFLAAFLDFIFLSVLGWIVNSAFGITRVTGGILPESGQNGWSSYTTATTIDWWWIAILAFSYFFVQEALLSTTAGKSLLKLRVIAASDDRKNWHITLWQAFLRNILRPFEVTQIPYTFGVNLIAVLCILLTKKRQRLGDLLARTIVVDSNTITNPTYHRFQMHQRVATILVVLVCFITFCSTFAYYGRPPLVIQGLQNTRKLMNGTVQSYTLGTPSWDINTVTYPIHFTSIDKGKRQACNGSIMLRWEGFPPGWSERNAQWNCTAS